MRGHLRWRFVHSGKNGEAMVKVEFHFDFGSPNAYLSRRVIPESSDQVQRLAPFALGLGTA